jgi:hypothetical protein
VSRKGQGPFQGVKHEKGGAEKEIGPQENPGRPSPPEEMKRQDQGTGAKGRREGRREGLEDPEPVPRSS